jgi:hypothetical protein
MSRITIAKLYARTRNDGAVTLSGRMGYDGRLRVEPNPNHDPDDAKSPDFLAFIEYAEPKQAKPYTGAQLHQPPRQSPRAFVEGEIVE